MILDFSSETLKARKLCKNATKNRENIYFFLSNILNSAKSPIKHEDRIDTFRHIRLQIIYLPCNPSQ